MSLLGAVYHNQQQFFFGSGGGLYHKRKKIPLHAHIQQYQKIHTPTFELL